MAATQRTNSNPSRSTEPGDSTGITLPYAIPGSPPPGWSESREARGGLKRFRAGWLALLAATLIALYLCWLMLYPMVEVLEWATVLTIVFYPARNFFLRRTGRPTYAAAVTCVLVALIILVPLTLIILAVIGEARSAADYFNLTVPKLLSRDTLAFRYLSKYLVDLDRLGSRNYIIQQFQQQFQTFSGAIAELVPLILGQVLIRILQVVFILLTMFYLFRDGDRISDAMLDAIPLERSQTQRIFERTREVIGASVYGVLAVATVQAILGGLAFWILGLPSPLLWTVLLFFLSMIPMAGSFVVWVPAAGYLAMDHHWIKAIVLAAWCAGVVGMIDNVLRPMLVGKRTRLHELLVFFSVLGGLKVFGMVGLVMGPVTVALTFALLDVFRKADHSAANDEPTLIEKQAALRNVPPKAGSPGKSPDVVAVVVQGPHLAEGIVGRDEG